MAWRMSPRSVNDANGSNSEVRARHWAVRFTLKNRRRQPGLSGPKSAKSIHASRSYSMTSLRWRPAALEYHLFNHSLFRRF